MKVMTKNEAIKYLEKQKNEAQDMIAHIKETSTEAHDLGVNNDMTSKLLYDYWNSIIDMCTRNLEQLKFNS